MAFTVDEDKNVSRFRLVRWKSDPGKGKESADFAKLFSVPAKHSAKATDASLPD